MIRLIKIEFKKILNNQVFWVLAALYVLIITSTFFGVQTFINDVVKDAGRSAPIPVTKISLYNFPDIWHNLTFLAGFLKMLLGLLVIFFITNEYSYRTLRQNIITGLSRKEFLISKLLSIGIISLCATFLLFIIGVILGFMNTEEVTLAMFFGNFEFITAYFLELTAFMIFALLLGFLTKRAAFAIGLLALYYYIIENWLNYKLPDDWGDFLPLQAVANLIDIPNTQLMKLFGLNFREYIAVLDVIVVLVYSLTFIYLMYLILRKRDL